MTDEDLFADLLAEVLVVEPDGPDRFVSHPATGSFDRMFGGHLLAQALLAGAATAPSERSVHSMHAYYLRLGDMSRPIEYQVTTLRDTSTYSARRVEVAQRERRLAEVLVSFHAGPAIVEHQQPMPKVSGPETLLTRTAALRRDLGDVAPLNAGVRWPFEVRCAGTEPWLQNPGEPHNELWFRAAGEVRTDDPLLHAAALAYCSDLHMFEIIVSPTDVAYTDLVAGRGVFGSSLDHTIWFHRPVRVDDWLLHVQESQVAHGARGHGTGRFYSRDGLLVASVAQEIGLTLADQRR